MAHQQLRNKAQSETHCQTATSTVDAASYQSEQLERKRSIDRRAQREHRKRQKLRVEELVAQNELLKRGGDEKVQALITENERLQNQIKSLHRFFSSVSCLVQQQNDCPGQVSDPSRPLQSQPPSTTSSLLQSTSATATLSPTQLWFRGVSTPSSIEQPSLSVFKEALPPTWETPLEEGWRSHALQASIDPGFEAKGDETLSIGDANDFCKLIDSLPRFRHELPTPTAHPDCEFHDRWPDHTASASAVVVAAAVSDETILPLDMFGSDPQQGHGELLIMTLELKLQPLLSTRLASPEPSDGRIDRIIESARLQMMADPDRMGPISIAGILGDDPNNILLRDVKRMLNPIRRARHMSTYLGICTVLYHLLHWHITQSPDSLKKVPTWLHPTRKQAELGHLACIDFLGWPLLRDELVVVCQKEPTKAEHYLATIAHHVELDIDPSKGLSEKTLNEAVFDLKNWRLRDGLFIEYPRWERAYKLSLGAIGKSPIAGY